MKKRITGVALVLALALTSLGFARGGPPVPDGCTFERGVTTCVVLGPEYDAAVQLKEGDTACDTDGVEFRIVSGIMYVSLARDATITAYRGMSHVVSREETRLVVRGVDRDYSDYSSAESGTCWPAQSGE